MQTSFSRLMLGLSFLLLFSCKVSQKTTTKASLSKDDGIIEFTFLQLNDVYEIAPLEGGKVGGMARVATLYKQLKKENRNTFFVLAGDFLNPSLVGTMKYEGERIKGRQMVEVMNACGVDLVVYGNHEFDVKEHELQARMNESDFAWLRTNVLQVKKDSTVPTPNEIVFESAKPLDGREVSVRTQQTDLGKLFVAGFAAAAKKQSDLAIMNGGSIRLDDQLEGQIQAIDIFRAMPFGGEVWEVISLNV